MKPLVRFHARSVLAAIALAAASESGPADHGSYHVRSGPDVPGRPSR
jgi:hypothetical protein